MIWRNRPLFESSWLTDVKKRVIAELTSLLTTNDPSTIPRNDYHESVENTLLILGETPLRGVHFMKPGAIHQAR